MDIDDDGERELVMCNEHLFAVFSPRQVFDEHGPYGNPGDP